MKQCPKTLTSPSYSFNSIYIYIYTCIRIFIDTPRVLCIIYAGFHLPKWADRKMCHMCPVSVWTAARCEWHFRSRWSARNPGTDRQPVPGRSRPFSHNGPGKKMDKDDTFRCCEWEMLPKICSIPVFVGLYTFQIYQQMVKVLFYLKCLNLFVLRKPRYIRPSDILCDIMWIILFFYLCHQSM